MLVWFHENCVSFGIRHYTKAYYLTRQENTSSLMNTLNQKTIDE